MRIAFATRAPASAARVLGVAADGTLPPATAAADAALGGALRRALGALKGAGKAGTTHDLVIDAVDAVERVVLVGLGDGGADALRVAGGAAAGALGRLGWSDAAVALDGDGAALVRFLEGSRLGAYRFGAYRTRQRDEDPVAVNSLTMVGPRSAAARRAWAAREPVLQAVALARDLVNEPANVVNPAAFVARAGAALSPLGVDVEALEPDRLKALGFGAMVAVAQGSANEPRVLILRWNGAANADEPPLAFVGKGLTFDSGGISIKKAEGMEDMKADMAGGAAVVGVLRALAGRKAPVNAVGVIGLAENMPSEKSYRPGDVVRTLAGLTVEVIDTDAEGRLVLADALHYTATRFKPASMIDLATLTYSVIAGLGRVYAGLYANDEKLAAELLAASAAEGEKLWRLPMHQDYDDNLESPIADVRQFAPDDAYANSPHAAVFLGKFVAGVPWAHLDIAGVDLLYKAPPTGPKGASGFGVRLLDQFARRRERRRR